MSTSPQDIQEAALALGLSIGPASCTAAAADAARRAAHHRRRRDSPSSSSPRQSLTLSLSDDGLPAHKAEAEASPCSAASSRSMSGVKKEKDAEEAERVSSRGSDEEDNSSGRKKLRLTKEQSAYLEDRFKEHSTLNPRQKQALAKQLNLRPRQVEVWFQNRRARTKLKQTEVDCELLKRYYEKLTSENQRLQKELQELKALKLAPAPSVYMQFPAATLTMCPSCERIGGGGAIDGGHPKVSSAGTVTGAAVVAPPKPSHFFNPFTHSATC